MLAVSCWKECVIAQCVRCRFAHRFSKTDVGVRCCSWLGSRMYSASGRTSERTNDLLKCCVSFVSPHVASGVSQCRIEQVYAVAREIPHDTNVLVAGSPNAQVVHSMVNGKLVEQAGHMICYK